jgi:hypothetical protein
MKPKVKAACSALESIGIRADYKHDPIYHHESRMEEDKIEKAEKAKKASMLTMDEAIVDYVDLPGVVMGGLDRERLKRLGREALMSARSRYGTV